MNTVSGFIPKIFGQVKDLEETYDEVQEFRDWADDSDNKEAYELAVHF